MSSVSSSSDEDNERFKEAIDEKFLTDRLYKCNESPKKKEIKSKPLPSLRIQNHEVATHNPFSIKVTPEYQKHVSKHLSRMLDESLDDTQIIQKKKKKAKKETEITGVKLLSTSKEFLQTAQTVEIQTKLKRHIGKNDTDSIDYEKRALEVAVSGEWVLSQEETKHWAPYTKGEVEVIKLNRSNCLNGMKKVKKKKKKKNKYVLML